MKILVVSDSHGDYYNLCKVIDSHRNAEIVFCLGDGEYDYDRAKEYYPDKTFIIVKGNCDIGSIKPTAETLSLEHAKIFATHGHMYGDLQAMYLACESKGANILLYGHTHRTHCEYLNGIYILNPGSIKGYDGSYGIIDIGSYGISTNIAQVHSR